MRNTVKRQYSKASESGFIIEKIVKFSDGSVRWQLSVSRKDFGPTPNLFSNCDQRYIVVNWGQHRHSVKNI